MADRRIQVHISGIVQGVGFRPFLHRLTAQLGLRGWVRNTPQGVELELEGSREGLKHFLSTLSKEAPPLAVIDKVETFILPDLAGYEGFSILASNTTARRSALVSPDVATCPDCLRELNDPSDRRYRYPFLNCTNCGPRFTIIRDLPYDRPRTAMGSFSMCPDCGAEYRDVKDRRYHAQPTCCPDCGPALTFLDGAGRPCSGDALDHARALLKRGGIVAVKGLGGFHLACLPTEAQAAELRRRKGRDEKPFALMCRDMAAVKSLCATDCEGESLLTSWRRPIVLLPKLPTVPDGLSDNNDLGVMLPYTPLHHLLMEDFEALVMTSANLSDDPVITDNGEAISRLAGIADGFLLHDRDIVTRCDDSLIRPFRGKEYPLRRSRGYAPQPVALHRPLPPILACGGEQKAVFSLSRGEQAFLSQHIGDVKNIATLTHYEAQIAHFEDLFDITPAAIACDAHPDHLTTRYAQKRAALEKLPLIPVYHHHAHMAACMADNSLDGECIGLIWDGTGYGADGTIWGGECLAGGYSAFRRLGSIRPIPLPGGDLCTREISRVAHALKWDSSLDIDPNSMVTRQLAANLNCPPSSGMGRLFDGVYSLLTGRETAGYEGQGAILLEAMAQPAALTLPVVFYEEDSVLRLDWRPMVTALCAALDRGESPAALAAAFMDALVSAGLEQCRRAREITGLDRVVLSGGVFQNMYLLPRLLDALAADAFTPYHHSRVATNDEGIALGQLMVAAAIRKEAP